MANRRPLVLKDLIIAEIQDGETLQSLPKTIPIIKRNGISSPVILGSVSYIPIVRRNGSVINITLNR